MNRSQSSLQLANDTFAKQKGGKKEDTGYKDMAIMDA